MYLLGGDVMYIYVKIPLVCALYCSKLVNIMIQSWKDIADKMLRRQKQYYRLLLFTNFGFPSQKKYMFSSVNKTEQQYANISKL